MTFNELEYKLFSNFEAGYISNTQLVQIIEQAAQYLNLQTLSDYSKNQGISYNGAKKRSLSYTVIGGVKFIIDNE
ncbi:MAG: hypothetical protein QM751_12995 [Paludibacteraceae bacterium]